MKLFSKQQDKASQSFDNEHTAAKPYCDNLSCWCHTNVSYHDKVQHPERSYTQEQVQKAYHFFGVRKY